VNESPVAEGAVTLVPEPGCEVAAVLTLFPESIEDGLAHHWRNAVIAPAVGEGVANGVWPLWSTMRVGVPTDVGEVGACPHTTDVTSAFCKKPLDLLRSAGAVIIGADCLHGWQLVGLIANGTSMKVFFTRSGIPLLVAPRSTAGFATGIKVDPGLMASSDKGAGRLPGILPACCSIHSKFVPS